MAIGHEPLPLFPLRTVLLPGARLRLRIFEPRYLDMVRDCARRGAGFGVCALLAGDEAGPGPVMPAAFGTEARLVDFETTPDGLLGITVEGGRRFHVAGEVKVRDNGLLVGEVQWREAPLGVVPLRPEHGLLSLLLARILEQVGGLHDKAPAMLLDCAEWVGWRLAELLPLELDARQSLLQEDDPHARMERLLALVSDLPRGELELDGDAPAGGGDEADDDEGEDDEPGPRGGGHGRH
jgi:Lon protease-like protein